MVKKNIPLHSSPSKLFAQSDAPPNRKLWILFFQYSVPQMLEIELVDAALVSASKNHQHYLNIIERLITFLAKKGHFLANKINLPNCIQTQDYTHQSNSRYCKTNWKPNSNIHNSKISSTYGYVLMGLTESWNYTENETSCCITIFPKNSEILITSRFKKPIIILTLPSTATLKTNHYT